LLAKKDAKIIRIIQNFDNAEIDQRLSIANDRSDNTIINAVSHSVQHDESDRAVGVDATSPAASAER